MMYIWTTDHGDSLAVTPFVLYRLDTEKFDLVKLSVEGADLCATTGYEYGDKCVYYEVEGYGCVLTPYRDFAKGKYVGWWPIVLFKNDAEVVAARMQGLRIDEVADAM